ncbi:hypothetical protein ACOMHN_024501 [Nucella lapillus]
MSEGLSCSEGCDAALVDMYSCIVDYACRHRRLDVICEVSQHMTSSLSSLTVPHVRLAGAGLYKMVVCDDAAQFHTALQLAQRLFDAVGTFTNGTLVRCYAKLLCGLRVKALFHCLQSSPKEAFTLLRKYFPRGGDNLDRQLSRHLIAHKSKCESFFSREYGQVYDHRFSRCLVKRAASFLTELEKGLPDTFLDEVLKGGWSNQEPVSTPSLGDALMEVLLDRVEGKTTLRSSDLRALLRDLRSCSLPDPRDILRGVRGIRLLSSLDGQSGNSESQGSQLSEGTPTHASSTVPHAGEGTHHKGVGTVCEEKAVTTDTDSSQPSDPTTTTLSASAPTPHSAAITRPCQGCRQSRRVRLSAVRPHRYCGQQGTYVSPACHVRLAYHRVAKPCKWGIKVWALADCESFYLVDFDIYTGKECATAPNVPLGTRVVRKLVSPYFKKYHHVYFDNYFTSVNLMEVLLRKKTYSCGTVRLNRRGLPDRLKRTKLTVPGQMLKLQKGRLLAVTWYDRKRQVSVLSTGNSTDNIQINRRGRCGLPDMMYPKPKAIQEYSENYNAVDKNDQLRSYYGIANKANKWWKYLFWFFCDVSMINAYIMHREAPGGPRPESLSHKEFQLQVSKGLINGFSSRKRYVPVNVEGPDIKRPTRHEPTKIQTKRGLRNCVVCAKGTARTPAGNKIQTSWECKPCGVALCKDNGCFGRFHNYEQ